MVPDSATQNQIDTAIYMYIYTGGSNLPRYKQGRRGVLVTTCTSTSASTSTGNSTNNHNNNHNSNKNHINTNNKNIKNTNINNNAQ
jgi:hypothetical protein